MARKPHALRLLKSELHSDVIAKAYQEIEVDGGGVMRCEAGDTIRTYPDGRVIVIPPNAPTIIGVA